MTRKPYNPDAWRAALKKYIAAEGLSVAGWAKKAGVSAGGFQDFLSGRNKSLTIETLEKLAAATGLKHNEILQKLFDVDGGNRVSNPVVMVPVVAWLSAGRFGEVPHEVIANEAEEFIPVISNRNTLIAVQVTGSSINRFIPDGSFAVIDYSETDLVPGAFYAIKNGDAECTLKRYRPDPDRFEPYSTDQHETIFNADEHVEIIGRVIQGSTPPPK